MKSRLRQLLCLTTVFILALPLSAAPVALELGVSDQVLHRIDHRIFGQFLERPSWGGEYGPESAVIESTGELDPRVASMIDAMEIPIIRFPGGTDIDYIDWTDMIDYAPGREPPERTVMTTRNGAKTSNRYGYDEYLQMAEAHGNESIIVLNIGDALFEKRSVEDAIAHACGLVAYCNAPLDNDLPEHLKKWPQIRARNGHPAPYEVEYFQIGNETWAFEKKLGETDALASYESWADIVIRYIDAIHRVDPDAKIIVDGHPEEVTKRVRAARGDSVEAFAIHLYKPWGIEEVLRDDELVPQSELSADEIWKAWVAAPETDAQGQAVITDKPFLAAREQGYDVAITEWNWNGWWQGEGEPALNSDFVRGLGAASYLHAILRFGDRVTLATQSMLVGESWGITGIRVAPDNVAAPYKLPSAAVTEFYSKLCGDRMLATEIHGAEFYEQPLKMNDLRPDEAVAYIDALATASEDAMRLLFLNRSSDSPKTVTLDLSAWPDLDESATLHTLSQDGPDSGGRSHEITQSAVKIVPGGTTTIELTAASVSVLVVPNSK